MASPRHDGGDNDGDLAKQDDGDDSLMMLAMKFFSWVLLYPSERCMVTVAMLPSSRQSAVTALPLPSCKLPAAPTLPLAKWTTRQPRIQLLRVNIAICAIIAAMA